MDAGRRRALALYTALVILVLGSQDYLLQRVVMQEYRSGQVSRVQNQLSTLRASLEAMITNTLLVVESLAAYVAVNPLIGEREFTRYAEELLRGHEHLRNLAVAPDFVFRYVYPREGNEGLVGTDLRSLPQQWPRAEQARTSGEIVLDGPIDLVQGGRGIVARAPVFIRSDTGRRFWGLASALIDFAGVVKDTDRQAAALGLRVAVRRDATGESGAIYGDAEVFNDPLVTPSSLSLPNDSWEIAAVPQGGWIRRHPFREIIHAMAVVLGCLSLTIIWIKLRKDYQIETQDHAHQRRLDRYVQIVDENVITSQTDLEGVITSVSAAFCAVSGYTREELIGAKHSMVQHPETPEETTRSIKETLARGETWHGQLRNRTRGGESYWVEADISPLRADDGSVFGYVSVQQDITHRKKVEELSVRDQLTGLWNRRKLDEAMESEQRRHERYGEDYALLMLDIDRFKLVNDSHGHLTGDEVLKRIAGVIRGNVRSSDIYGRWGGEEFLVICPHTTLDGGCSLAEHIRAAVERTDFGLGRKVTASVGVAATCGTYDGDHVELLHAADRALYRAKTSGRNRVESDFAAPAEPRDAEPGEARVADLPPSG